MDQVLAAWTGLDSRRRATVVAATLGVFLSVYFLAQIASQPRMALLYAGLDPAAAGEVVSALEAQGATVEIRGSAIYVDATNRDALRLSLASEGLPQNGGQGYELLDSLSGFGTTAQMFDAAYWRAKEGELARTIMANRQFSSARVHLSNPASDPFRQGQVDAASVSVNTPAGGLTPGQATALRFLVASAVAGLEPKNVSIIDGSKGLMPNTDDPLSTALSMSGTRAEALKSSVTRLLEARVGPGKAIVEVSIEPITEREEISERRFDPDSRVAISSDAEETTQTANDQGQRGVTVASNLPDGEAGNTTATSQSREARTRETINYEVSETQRAIIREPGAIRRISVAVLVDGVSETDSTGAITWSARSQNELDDLRELIASAVGIDESRGDTVTIRSMQFEPTPEIQLPPPPGLVERLYLDPMRIIQVAVLAIVSLVLGLFVIRPMLSSSGVQSDMQTKSLPNTSLELQDLTLPDIGDVPQIEQNTSDVGDFSPLADLPSYENLQTPSDPSSRLRQLIEQKEDETVEVLGQWMQDRQRPAR